MKVLIDASVFLSYILAPDRRSVVTEVVAACLRNDEIDLLVPPEQLAELVAKVANKRYFRTRIPQAVIENFAAQLEGLSNLQPLEAIAAYSRDPKDDYLVAYGIINDVDYLITGDKDLLVLNRVQALQIVTPSQFHKLLPAQEN